MTKRAAGAPKLVILRRSVLGAAKDLEFESR
jgi:hypothetical protein